MQLHYTQFLLKRNCRHLVARLYRIHEYNALPRNHAQLDERVAAGVRHAHHGTSVEKERGKCVKSVQN